MRRRLVPFITAAFMLPAVAAAQAPNAKPVRIELNKLEPGEGKCRTHLVITNKGKEAYSSFKVDLVFFDKKGVVTQRIAIDLAPLRAEKTSVIYFDVPEVDCAGLSKVLLNDVTACSVGTDAQQNCVTRVETTSRSGAQFIK